MTHRETEVRHGQPLRYIAGKVEAAIKSLHFTLRKAALIPDDIENPVGYPATFSVKADVVEAPVSGALSDLLKAFLALLDLDWWSPEYLSGVVAMSSDELDAEIRRAWDEGSFIGSRWPEGGRGDS